jgi:ABC-type branched-subunit amino acid transport system ATPase component/MFS family permease
MSAGRTTWEVIRHPRRSLDTLTGAGPTYPLLILFGLNAVDELDRTAFGVLLPNIREEFGLNLTVLLTIVALVGAAALALQIPIAQLADRTNRTRLALTGAVVWAVFSFATGLAWTLWALAVARGGSGIGKAVVDPTHNSLLADYYEPEQRPKVFAFHRAANLVGQMTGPIVAGLLAFQFGWRVPFIVFAVPTLLLVVAGLRMREPVRGAHERRAMGATEDAIETEEEPPSFAEAWRMMYKIESLRRIWYALPFLAASLIGFGTFASLLYDEVFGLDERARGFLAAAVEPAGILGLIIGAGISSRLMARDPGLVLRFLAVTAVFNAGILAVFALAPNVWVAAGAAAGASLVNAMFVPSIFAVLSMAIPPRARALGFSIGSLWVLPGLVVLPLIGAIGDAWGIRTGMLLMTPVYLVGGLLLSTAGLVIGDDIKQVWATAAARSEVAHERSQGRSKLLLVRGLNVSYGDVQVLFDVDFEVDEGEIVALLGTNGAGKSTLLKSISGVVEADRGAIIFDGREMTFAPPHEVAGRGVVQVPGGAGVFPGLTISENLEVAGWLRRRDPAARIEGVQRVYEMFPALTDRRDEPAANLSGGQQQMLAIGMALLSKPRLLMVDELSLGLAPVIVEQLLPVLRQLADEGTTIILVDQSVNVALTIAETAYFMEKGEIRFHGPTAELLDRPDVLRSVFLEGAGAAVETRAGTRPTPTGGAVAMPRENHDPADTGTGTALETVKLTRSFGGIVAVDQVSLSVSPEEILGLIGPNGAGKTTLFDLIAGFTTPDTGRVLLDGRDITTMSPHRRARVGLGRSFQDARLFPSLTVEEAMAVALELEIDVRSAVAAMLYLPNVHDAEEKVRHRVDELIELLGLESFRSKFLRELSTGSRRIVDLACVVAHSPKVVLLDEPSSGIAQRETEALAPVLLRIREHLGASILVIEHDMALVSAIADRIVALDQGAVVTDGTADEVLHHPEVIASYLGTNEDVIARSGERHG